MSQHLGDDWNPGEKHTKLSNEKALAFRVYSFPKAAASMFCKSDGKGGADNLDKASPWSKSRS